MKKVFLVLAGITFAVILGWVARGQYEVANSVTMKVPRVAGASNTTASLLAPVASPVSAKPPDVPPPTEPTEPLVPIELLVPIATVPATTPPPADTKEVASLLRDSEEPRPIIVPVAGVAASEVRDMFNEGRGDHRHEAIDIMAPRGTPVIAAGDGVVKKLFTSVAGGLTVYEFDPDERFCYYYAHLDRYVDGLHEGQRLRRGETLGYVGSTGNASKDAPHLHFALIRLDAEKRWWKGAYVNPYPLLVAPYVP